MEFSIDASKDGMLLISNKKGLYKNENIFTINGELAIFKTEFVCERDNNDTLLVENLWKESKEASSIFENFKTRGKIIIATPIKVIKKKTRW